MMKKTLLLSFFLMTLFYSFSQEVEGKKGNLFFSFKLGYTIPVAQTTIGSPRSEVGNSLLSFSNQGTPTYSEKNPFGSRGAGTTVAGSIGYMINDNFGLEMEFSFLRSTKILDASRNEVNSSGKSYLAEQYSYTNMFRTATMLVVQGDPNKKFVPYSKFGVLLPMAGKTIVEVNIEDQLGILAEELLPILNPELATELAAELEALGLPNIPIPTNSYIKAKTAGAFSVGFAARVGCQYNISDKIALFGEMEFNMLSVLAKETKFVEFSSIVDEDLVATAETLLDKEPGSIQGEYGIYDIPEILRLTTYQNEITETSNRTYDVNNIYFDRNQPYQQLNFRDNYNSFGIMLGFRYRFVN